MQEFLDKKIAETKKEIDRLTTRRQEELGNSICSSFSIKLMEFPSSSCK